MALGADGADQPRLWPSDATMSLVYAHMHTADMQRLGRPFATLLQRDLAEDEPESIVDNTHVLLRGPCSVKEHLFDIKESS